MKFLWLDATFFSEPFLYFDFRQWITDTTVGKIQLSHIYHHCKRTCSSLLFHANLKNCQTVGFLVVVVPLLIEFPILIDTNQFIFLIQFKYKFSLPNHTMYHHKLICHRFSTFTFLATFTSVSAFQLPYLLRSMAFSEWGNEIF